MVMTSLLSGVMTTLTVKVDFERMDSSFNYLIFEYLAIPFSKISFSQLGLKGEYE